MNNPKVLIYMPCYNHEKYVKEAIDSIVNQTYENWELYVANDGSTDSSASIIASYTDKRIHLFNFKDNTALIGVALFLYNHMRDIDAKYLAGTASDDMWEPDKLEKQVKFLEEHEEYKACFTWDKIILNNLDDQYSSKTEYSHVKNQSRYNWLRHYLYNDNCMNACSCLMHKDVYYELGGMNQCFRQLADLRLWIMFASKYPIYVYEEELTFYRRHDTNLSGLSVEVIARDRNEAFNIWTKIFTEIDRETFRRTFYKDILHTEWDTDEAFEAEKFALLLNIRGNRVCESIATNIYLNNSSNQKFLELLEKDYGYTPKDFLKLSGNGGMIYYLINSMGGKSMPPTCEKGLSPAYILMNTIDNRVLGAGTLVNYTYSGLIDLYKLTNGNQQFDKFNLHISQLRGKLFAGKKNKTVFILQGEDSEFDYKEELKDYLTSDMKCYYGRVPNRMHIMEETSPEYDICYEDEHISIVDKEHRSMRFLYDSEVKPDIIYYIDCVDNDYDCLDMIAGYPMSVEQNCIMKTDVFQQLQETSNANLMVCNAVFTY